MLKKYGESVVGKNKLGGGLTHYLNSLMCFWKNVMQYEEVIDGVHARLLCQEYIATSTMTVSPILCNDLFHALTGETSMS